MQVNSATAADRASMFADQVTSPAITGKKTALNSQDFMKLLSVQFQHQDPMKPMEDTAFIAQMAQFSGLEQSSALVQQMTQLSASQGITAANSYLGQQVTLNDGKGGTVTGQVSGVEMASGTPRLIVGDYTYPLSAVLLVEPAVFAPAAELPPAA